MFCKCKVTISFVFAQRKDKPFYFRNSSDKSHTSPTWVSVASHGGVYLRALALVAEADRCIASARDLRGFVSRSQFLLFCSFLAVPLVEDKKGKIYMRRFCPIPSQIISYAEFFSVQRPDVRLGVFILFSSSSQIACC